MCPACLLEHGLLGFAASDAAATPSVVATNGGPTSEGQRFGDYELLAEVSGGGMGVVYRARQRSLNRVVAVKMIRAGHLAGVADIKRFRTEAEAVAKLQHPNIVAIHEVGEVDGQHYFSMEFVEGRSLAELVREHPLPPREAARCVRTVAEAIQFAHGRGVLHRDLKPSNIMVGADGAIRVTDFGLAKVIGDAELTQTGAVLGSPGYMPPEQAQGRVDEITERSDVYALGGILYELLTGRPPFPAATPLETLKLVVEQEPVPPRQLNPRLPRDLDTICLKCLEKSPARRYETAEDLADELGRFLEDQPIEARATTRLEKLWRWCRRQPGLAGLLVLSFILLAALAVVSASHAERLRREAAQTRAARRDAEERLWSSYLAQARAGRLSGVAGRRFDSLAAVTAAARMKPSLELRNEAIASLALSDLGTVRTWRKFSENESPPVVWDRTLEISAAQKRIGWLVVERIADRTILAEFELSRAQVRHAEFSSDSRYLVASANDGRVRVWPIDRSTPIADLKLPTVPGQGNLIAFHPDGRWLALVGQDQHLHFYEVVTGAHPPPIRLDSMPVSVTYSPAGDQLAVVSGAEILRWSWPKRESLKAFKHGARLTCLAWHPDGRRVAAGDTLGGLVGWDTKLDLFVGLPAHNQHVSRLAFHPKGEVLVSHGWDGLSRFWDVASARQLFAAASGLATQFSGDGSRLAFHRELDGFGQWEFVRSDVFQTLTSPLPLTGVDVSPDGQWLAIAEGTGWRLWDLLRDRELAYIALPSARSPCFHPDGRRILVVSADGLTVWPLTEAESGERLSIGPPKSLVKTPGKELQRVSLSTDGRLVAVAGRFRSFFFDWDNPDRVTDLEPNWAESHITLSPDRRWFVTTTHNGVGTTLWNDRGRLERILMTNENSIAAFSIDGRWLVTTSPRDYCFWDTRTWEVRRRMPLDLGSAVAGPIAFSPDGKLLAVAANRRDIKLLRPDTGDELATLTAPDPQNLARLTFNADGSRLAVTTIGRAIQIWDLRKLRQHLTSYGLNW